MSAAPTPPADPADRRKPQDDEIDVYGLTHTGLLRKENQDHFLIASLNRHMLVHRTSLPDHAALPREPERMAFLALVADGVGSGAGEEASRLAVQTISQYIMRTVRTSYAAHAAAHVLASAIGGLQAAPVVTQFDQRWGLIGLLCSDGLTKHVPDARIAERLAVMTSARQVCEALLQDALDGGGSDNITIVAGRTLKRD